jgi:hypothetical protein
LGNWKYWEWREGKTSIKSQNWSSNILVKAKRQFSGLWDIWAIGKRHGLLPSF